MKVLVTQLCPTPCNPMDCSPPDSSVHGILQARILEWLPFPSPGDLPDPGIEPRSPTLDSLWSEPPGKRSIYTAAAKSLQSCLTVCNPIDGSPPGSPCPWDSPGKNTGMGCHFLLQWMKVKSEKEVTQSYLTLHDPMGCSLPGSSVHGIFQARVLE